MVKKIILVFFSLVVVIVTIFLLSNCTDVRRLLKDNGIEKYDLAFAIDISNRQARDSTFLLFVDVENPDSMVLFPFDRGQFPYYFGKLLNDTYWPQVLPNIQNNSRDALLLIYRKRLHPYVGKVILIDSKFQVRNCPLQQSFYINVRHSPITLVDDFGTIFIDHSDNLGGRVVEYDYQSCVATRISEREQNLVGVVYSSAGYLAKIFQEIDPSTDETGLIMLLFPDGKEAKFLDGLFPAFSPDGEIFSYVKEATYELVLFSTTSKTSQEVSLPDGFDFVVNLAWDAHNTENRLYTVLAKKENNLRYQWVYFYVPESETWVPLVELPETWHVLSIQPFFSLSDD